MVTDTTNEKRSPRRGRSLPGRIGLGAALAFAGGGVAAAANAPALAATATGGSLAPIEQRVGPSGGVLANAQPAASPARSAAKPYSTVNASPRIVSAGSQVKVTGEAPRNARAGAWITLISKAFVSKSKVAGTPAVRTQVLVNGKYAVTARVREGLKPAKYKIAGAYNGRPFETSATIKVRPYSTVSASPRTLSAGQQVTISGEGPRNARTGAWITLQSAAFVSKTEVQGIPAIRTQVMVNGKYSVRATIAKGLQPTNYAISGSYNGKPLETVAWITVK